MTGHYGFFSRLDSSFELWVKLRARGRKQQKRCYVYVMYIELWMHLGSLESTQEAKVALQISIVHTYGNSIYAR